MMEAWTTIPLMRVHITIIVLSFSGLVYVWLANYAVLPQHR